jgi:hypothetical protein
VDDRRNERTKGDKRCPVCGLGELVDITYTEGSDGDMPMQEADSRQVATYSCGHERVGPRLDESASADSALDVERRSSPETADPLDGGS